MNKNKIKGIKIMTNTIKKRIQELLDNKLGIFSLYELEALQDILTVLKGE